MMADSIQTPSKRYRGSSAEERRAERRTRLVRAAVRTYGQRGYHNTSVKAVCEAAGLTERYFYESFANSEALLVACLRAVTQRLVAAVRDSAGGADTGPAGRVRRMLATYFTVLQRDPAAARVFLVEIGGVSPLVDQEFRQALGRFADAIADAWGLPPDGRDPLLLAGMVGGVMHLALAWAASGYARPLPQVVEAALRLCAVLGPAGEG